MRSPLNKGIYNILVGTIDGAFFQEHSDIVYVLRNIQGFSLNRN